MAQVSTLTEPTSLSPVPAATVSEAKPTPKDTATDNSTLDSLLKQEGFGVVKLAQKNLGNQKAHKNYPKHLIIDVEVNRVSASLIGRYRYVNNHHCAGQAQEIRSCRAKDFSSSHQSTRISFQQKKAVGRAAFGNDVLWDRKT